MSSHHIEVGSLRSWPNNKKYDENEIKNACQLTIHPIINHGNKRSQSLV
jgi:hypothetical protein